MQPITITILGRLPCFNEYDKEARRHKMKAAGMKDDYTQSLAWQIHAKHKGLKIKRAHFAFAWYEATKQRDPDNISFAQKFIFDALQWAGVLENDSWKQVASIKHDFHLDKQNPRVEITIKAVE